MRTLHEEGGLPPRPKLIALGPAHGSRCPAAAAKSGWGSEPSSRAYGDSAEHEVAGEVDLGAATGGSSEVREILVDELGELATVETVGTEGILHAEAGIHVDQVAADRDLAAALALRRPVRSPGLPGQGSPGASRLGHSG